VIHRQHCSRLRLVRMRVSH